MKYLKLILTSLITGITLIVLSLQIAQSAPDFKSFNIHLDKGNEEIFEDIEVTGSRYISEPEHFSYINHDLLHTQDYNFLERLDSLLRVHSRKEDEMLAKYPELFRDSRMHDHQFYEDENYYFVISLPVFYNDEQFDKKRAPMTVKLLNKKTEEIKEFTVHRESERIGYSYFNLVGAYYEAPNLYIVTNNLNHTSSGNNDSLVISHYDTDQEKLMSTTESDIFTNTDLSGFTISRDQARTTKRLIVQGSAIDDQGYNGLILVDLPGGTFKEVALPEKAPMSTDQTPLFTVYQSRDDIVLSDERDPDVLKMYRLNEQGDFETEPFEIKVNDSLQKMAPSSDSNDSYEVQSPEIITGYTVSLVDGKIYIQTRVFDAQNQMPFQVNDLKTGEELASGHFEVKLDGEEANNYQISQLIHYFSE